MALTKLSRNFLIAIVSLLVYTIIGGFSHPILSFIIFSIITLWLVFLLSIPKNEDMDMLTAFCIHGRGVKCPEGDTPITMTQNALIYFEDKLDFDAIKECVIREFYKYKRLSHIGILKTPQSALWSTKWKPIEITKDVHNRMIKKHIVNNNDELNELSDKLCNEHLPKDLPLWIFHYIENNNGDSLWILRISHGIADGIRLIPIAGNILQDINGKAIGAPTTGVLRSSNSMTNKNKIKRIGPHKMNSIQFWMNPKTYYNLIRDIHKVWYTINGSCDTINAFKPDEKIHGPKLGQIHIRNKIPFKISDIKLLKNKYNVSFNDVITCLVCSGIRAYILSKDDTFFKKHKNVTMTALLAFGFPPNDVFYGQSDWLRNGFSLIDWEFPIQIEDFGKRLSWINKNGKRLKTSFVTPLGLGITEFLARLGFDDMLDNNFSLMFARHSCVFSNLPSWNEQLYFNRVKVTKLEASFFSWIPQFLFISYNQCIYGTLAVDPNRFPNAQIILDTMNQEINRQTK